MKDNRWYNYGGSADTDRIKYGYDRNGNRTYRENTVATAAGTARIAVFDGMGHGLASARLAVLAIGAYRHARRSGLPLVETCLEVDTTLIENFGGTTFTTAVLAELETRTGLLRWVNAGHPEPLLLRQGRLVKTLHAAPRPPLGLNLSALGVSSASSR